MGAICIGGMLAVSFGFVGAQEDPSPAWVFGNVEEDVVLAWSTAAGRIGQEIRREGFILQTSGGGPDATLELTTPAGGHLIFNHHAFLGTPERHSSLWYEEYPGDGPVDAVKMFEIADRFEGEPMYQVIIGPFVVVTAFMGGARPEVFVQLTGDPSGATWDLDTHNLPGRQDPPIPANPEYRPWGRVRDPAGSFMIDTPGLIMYAPFRPFPGVPFLIASPDQRFRTWPLVPGDDTQGGHGTSILGVWQWRQSRDDLVLVEGALEDGVVRPEEMRRMVRVSEVRGIPLPEPNRLQGSDIIRALANYQEKLRIYFNAFRALELLDPPGLSQTLFLKYTEMPVVRER